MSWDACTNEPNAWLRWMECHPGFSGYVQAAGVILTVAGAVFGPPLKASYERWKYRRALRSNSDAFALSRQSLVEAMRGSIGRRLTYMQSRAVDISEPYITGYFGVEIPGALDTSLMRDTTGLDVERLDFLFSFVEHVRDYNNAAFKLFEIADKAERDGEQNELVSQLELLQAESDAVLKTIRDRS
jgi:hypothetical protein